MITELLVTLLVSLFSLVPSYGTQGIQQLNPFRVTGGRVEIASTTAHLRIPSLGSVDCIGATNGILGAGTCSGSSSGWATTSADYWQTQRNFFSTTSAQYFLSVNQGNAFSTTSANYWESTKAPRNDFSYLSNFAATNAATTSNMWLQGILNASSTSNFHATTTLYSALRIATTSTVRSNAVYIDCGKDYPTSISTGGCANINNTNNAASALTIWTDHAAGATARPFIVNVTNTGFDQEAASIQSVSDTRTALGVICSANAQGCEKITKNGSGADANGSALSIDLVGTSTQSAAMGIFITSSATGTTGKLIQARNIITPGAAASNLFDLTADGKLGLSTSSPYARLSVVGETVSTWFTATSTTRASTLPYASTTALSAITLCLSSDCRTSWPTGGSGGGSVSTSSQEASGRLPFWTSSNGTPAALSGGSADLTWDNDTSILSISNLRLLSGTVRVTPSTGDNPGGSLDIIAGNGDSVSGNANGGPLNLYAGNAAATSGNGADLTLNPGAGSGAGANGRIVLNGNASSTIFSALSASSTLYFGAGLQTCDPTTGKLTWSAGVFGCGTDQTGGGASFGKAWEMSGGYLAPTTSIATLHPGGFVSQASSTVNGNFTAALATNGIAQLNDGSSASGVWSTNIGFLSEGGVGRVVTSGAVPIVFHTGGTRNTMTEGTNTEWMRITTGGLIGIATSSPYARLSVAGEGVFANITATSTTATSSLQATSITGAVSLLGEYFTNFTTYVRSLFTGGQGINLSGGTLDFDCSEVEGTGINCSGENITLDATGDWTGTFDGVEGSVYAQATGDTYSGTHDMSGATVKEREYKSFTWPGTATTTTATTTLPMGAAGSNESWFASECKVTSGTGGYRYTDGTNTMDYRAASTTFSYFGLSTNNTFSFHENRAVEIGPLTAAQLTCTYHYVKNNS